MNIAISARMLKNNPDDGISWFTYETVRRLVLNNKGHRFYLLFDRSFDKSMIFPVNTEVIIIKPATRHPLLWYFWLECRVPGVLRKIKADIFVSPDGLISMRSKVPSIPVIHDINFFHRPTDIPPLTRFYYRHFISKFAAKAIRVATVSEFSKRDIATSLAIDDSKIDVVYNGVSDIFYPAAESECIKSRNELTGGLPYFLFVGNFSPRKNIPTLVKAYSHFRSISDYRHKLVLTGERLYLNRELDSIIKSSPYCKDIILTGNKKREELRLLYSAAEALVFVPWFEGFGIPVVESMRCGTPVILSDTTSLPEIGGDAALYVNPSDVANISGSMIKLIEDVSLRFSLKQASLINSMKYTWEKSAVSLWESIEKALVLVNN
jgi:glycosyltransferase involved in cell wall biosynthesis